jgi:F-type H+-transporting ATPase subunit gamma
MSKRHELEEHLRTLSEISGILGAMKNLSLMETHKLARFLSAQRRVVVGIESAAADFLAFYPDVLGRPVNGKRVYLAIGSERGFCGDFNESLLAAMEKHLDEEGVGEPVLIAVGRKLATIMEGDRRVAARLDGPAVAEEVQPVLVRLMDTMRELQARQELYCPLDLTVIHHSSDAEGLRIQVHQPFRQIRRQAATFSYPPIVNLDPFTFVTGLFDQYLYAVLHEVFYSSLMAENLRRFQHMEQAIRRLDENISDLALKRNVLRQEEITEEIEIIMLSAEALKNQ